MQGQAEEQVGNAFSHILLEVLKIQYELPDYNMDYNHFITKL